MKTHVELATELFEEGYNCAQSIAGAFSAEMGMDLQHAVQMASSFGGGMGRLREVCGAVSGMFLVAGALYGYTDPKDKRKKDAHYMLIQDLANQFKTENGTIICRELLGMIGEKVTYISSPRTGSYYRNRPCEKYVAEAARILEELIVSHESGGQK